MTKLEELRALLEAATPGPWVAHTSTEACEFLSRVVGKGNAEVARFTADWNPTEIVDCELVAALVNTAPDLLRVVEAALKLQDYCRRVAADPMQAWAKSPIDEFNEALEPFRR